MRIITDRDLIRALPKRLRGQYPEPKSSVTAWDPWGGKSEKQVIDEVEKLDLEKATAADIRGITPRLELWIQQHCDQCQNITTRGIEVGEEADCESRTALLCEPCFLKAAKLLFPLFPCV